MGFLDKAKAAAEQAAAKAKEGVEDVQVKRELGQAYGELGKAAFDLAERGDISHPELEELVAKIRGLNEKASSADDAAPAEEGAEAESADAGEPPAPPA